MSYSPQFYYLVPVAPIGLQNSAALLLCHAVTPMSHGVQHPRPFAPSFYFTNPSPPHSFYNPNALGTPRPTHPGRKTAPGEPRNSPNGRVQHGAPPARRTSSGDPVDDGKHPPCNGFSPCTPRYAPHCRFRGNRAGRRVQTRFSTHPGVSAPVWPSFGPPFTPTPSPSSPDAIRNTPPPSERAPSPGNRASAHQTPFSTHPAASVSVSPPFRPPFASTPTPSSPDVHCHTSPPSVPAPPPENGIRAHFNAPTSVSPSFGPPFAPTPTPQSPDATRGTPPLFEPTPAPGERAHAPQHDHNACIDASPLVSQPNRPPFAPAHSPSPPETNRNTPPPFETAPSPETRANTLQTPFSTHPAPSPSVSPPFRPAFASTPSPSSPETIRNTPPPSEPTPSPQNRASARQTPFSTCTAISAPVSPPFRLAFMSMPTPSSPDVSHDIPKPSKPVPPPKLPFSTHPAASTPVWPPFGPPFVFMDPPSSPALTYDAPPPSQVLPSPQQTPSMPHSEKSRHFVATRFPISQTVAKSPRSLIPVLKGHRRSQTTPANLPKTPKSIPVPDHEELRHFVAAPFPMSRTVAKPRRSLIPTLHGRRLLPTTRRSHHNSLLMPFSPSTPTSPPFYPPSPPMTSSPTPSVNIDPPTVSPSFKSPPPPPSSSPLPFPPLSPLLSTSMYKIHATPSCPRQPPQFSSNAKIRRQQEYSELEKVHIDFINFRASYFLLEKRVKSLEIQFGSLDNRVAGLE